jgi:hypothetical protein
MYRTWWTAPHQRCIGTRAGSKGDSVDSNMHGRRNSDNISVLRACKMKILRMWKPQGQIEGAGIVATGIIVFAKARQREPL